jgi:uncharacterized membrane protein
MQPTSKTPAILGLVGSTLGLVFASYSTLDYAEHLDRRLHDVHCSFIPGLAAGADQENPCRAAMYSVYSALFRGAYWGGVPISLFAVGAFSFFVGFSLYILLAGPRASQRALLFYALFGCTPLAVSLVMFFISATQLGSFCKTCVGIYLSSALLAAGAIMAFVRARREPDVDPMAEPLYAHRSPHVAPRSGSGSRPQGNLVWFLAWPVLLGVAAVLPALVYVTHVPNQLPYLKGCGKLEKATETHGALLKMKTARSVRPTVLFEDPLCPTCKAFHQRIVAEGAFDRLDVQMAMFPLDNECNWMLSSALHPGACVVSKAVICGADRAREVLEWAYEEQDELTKLGKAGERELRNRIGLQWGTTMLNCMDTTATKVKLNQQLHFAADNAIPVSTPQMYLGDLRVCDEDTDLGLRYTLTQLAPEIMP